MIEEISIMLDSNIYKFSYMVISIALMLSVRNNIVWLIRVGISVIMIGILAVMITSSGITGISIEQSGIVVLQYGLVMLIGCLVYFISTTLFRMHDSTTREVKYYDSKRN